MIRVESTKSQWVFFIGALLGLFSVVAWVDNMLVSFILAMATYSLLVPAVDSLERRGMNRTVATLIPFVLTATALVISGILFFPSLVEQIKTLQESLPTYSMTFKSNLEMVRQRLQGFTGGIMPMDPTEWIENWAMESASALFEKVPRYISRSLTVLFLAPFFSFFMLVDGRQFVRKLLRLVPNSVFELSLHLNHEISLQMSGFIRARLIESLIVGLITWLGLMMIQFPYALLLALFAAIMNIVPYVGPLIGALPAVFIAFAGGGGDQLVNLLLIYAFAQIFDTVVLVPFLVARIVDLHPLLVVVAVIVGAQLMGIIGMIICIPIVSAMKVTLVAIYRHMLSARP